MLADAASVIGSMVAMSGKMLRTIRSRVEPSLLGGPPLPAESS
jgi:hypothetical protein